MVYASDIDLSCPSSDTVTFYKTSSSGNQSVITADSTKYKITSNKLTILTLSTFINLSLLKNFDYFL